MPTQSPNAAPMTLLLGIQDNSGAALAVTPSQVPTHLAKVYLYAQKGPTTPQLVGEGTTQMFGADTFDLRKPYATHQTVLSTVLSGQGNAQMIERLVPADAGPKANMTLWLDVLPTQIPKYERNADGSYIVDGITGDPVAVTPAATVPGYLCKWVLTTDATGTALSADSTLFGNKTSQVGDQTAGTGGSAVTSTRYPILQFWADSFGSYGNNAGIRVWAPTVNDESPVNSLALSGTKAYPFRLAAINRVNSSSTAKISPMVTGDQNFDFVLETGVINPYTDAQMYLNDLFANAYSSTAPGYDPVYADISGLHIYQNYIDTLVAEFYTAEVGQLLAGQDWTVGATDEAYKFNFISGQSSFGIPYQSFQLQTADANAIALTESTNLWAASGFDGTMNETLFAGLVTTAVTDYSNQLSPLMNTAVNVESIIYDTGFPLATKQALCNFIAIRKDTAVVLSTYDVLGPQMTESDEAALGAALRTQLQLYPESTYFGTPVCRGIIVARNGTMIGSDYTKNLPLTIELANKMAAFMGAGNGSWNKEKLFDHGDAAVVTLFKDLNVTWVPGSQRNKDWDIGLNYPISFSRDESFFPALKTVYNDDTSVLTSIFTVMGCVQLQKVGEQVWREFTGVVSLTEAQLIAKVNQSVVDKTNGKFAGLFRIIPDCTITAADEQRGYSWTLPIKIYANNMKSVMTLSVQAFRMSQAPTA